MLSDYFLGSNKLYQLYHSANLKVAGKMSSTGIQSLDLKIHSPELSPLDHGTLILSNYNSFLHLCPFLKARILFCLSISCKLWELWEHTSIYEHNLLFPLPQENKNNLIFHFYFSITNDLLVVRKKEEKEQRKDGWEEGGGKNSHMKEWRNKMREKIELIKKLGLHVPFNT